MMTFRNENAPAGTRASFETKLNPDYKQMPAYGKQFMAMRQSGKIPGNRVMVTFDWDLGKAYPRIVIADDTPADQLNFNYLAGLAVQVVYRRKDAHRVSGVINAILKVNPSCLATFALDLVDTGNAPVLIKPYQEIQIAEAA
ncbi:hypothetical protein C8R32_10871 [Nitrosospira sp. Nsp5]|uniref:HIRAN domain-containing protein n=1 Tax=Nitrosospira multiformis TaxID=1231 RepID=A0ABY0T6J8_9PROT|nr:MULTISPECIES: hypothetical protein [Nitrosospira]PTR07115.1 hypothetical protein C8R32_10871 [Nitrosospira sp. Nsp5]SDQ33820.1 hypothetical protein SAMN05216402_0448 [Nitrosospira multiformis]